MVEDRCEWLREVDFQPRAEAATSAGCCSRRTARVEEYAIESDYHETWVRLPESPGPTAAWPRDGRLLVAAEPALAPARLGMELSFGRISADGAWTIAHSSLPWCEGRAPELGHRREWVCRLCEDGVLAPG